MPRYGEGEGTAETRETWDSLSWDDPLKKFYFICKIPLNKKKIEENCHCLTKIHLEVSEINTKGISFYKKMGFKKIYTRKKYYSFQNKKIDAFLMVKNY